MSLLGELKPKKGSTFARKRVGRGDSSNWGKTAGKGHKGQKARAGGDIRRGFEGGQMPLARRIPKFGFNNANFRRRYEIVNIKDLEKYQGEVTPETLREAGRIGSGKLKILGDGELSQALTVKAHKFSAQAKSAIESAGGKCEVI